MENIPGVKSAVVIKGTIRTGGIDLRKTSVHLCEFLQWATFQDLDQFKPANNVSAYTHKNINSKYINKYLHYKT